MIKKDRYPGIRAFEADDERLFYGRTTEVDDLFSLVMVKPLVVLFGKSGLGKSSLLKAGLGSVLLKNQYFPIMIRVQDTGISPVDMVLSELEPYIDQQKLAQFGSKSTNQIWEAINACSFKDSNGDPTTPVLIFDQFEELFNHDRSVQSQWAAQIADLIEGRRPKDVTEALHGIPRRERTPEQLAWFEPPEVKLLFAIRSDRMSALHQLRYQIPGILQHRYELKPLQSIQAREAIIKPAALTGAEFTTQAFNYAPETVQEIQNNLSNEVGEIESFQLQVVCQHIEEKVKAQQFQGMQDILATPDFLGGQGGIQNILKNYYDNHINNLGNLDNQLAARKLLEEGLIADGRRIGVADAVVKGTYGIDDDLLEKLLDSRLIRPENTRLGRTYEISHDTLVAPILAAYEKRRLEEERIAKQKELEERDRQLAIERNKRRRSNMITAGAVVLSLLAIGASIFAWVKWDQATEAKAFAFEKQVEAEKSAKTARQREQQAITSDSLAKLETQKAVSSDSLTKLALKDAKYQKEIAIEAKQNAEMAESVAIYEKEKANSIIDALYFYGDSLALASRLEYGGKIKYGFINKQGKPIIDYKYIEATPFNYYTGYAKVREYHFLSLLSPEGVEYDLADRVEDLHEGITALHLPEIIYSDDEGWVNNQPFEDTIFNFKRLEILILRGNYLGELPPDINKLENLRELNLSSNRLNSLPSEIGDLDSLRSLDLSINSISKLPNAIWKLEKLEKLDLSMIEIGSLPLEIGNLKSIRELKLGGNFLGELPKEVGLLKSLQYLDLNHNEFFPLPAEIGNLKNLQYLDLSFNELNSLPPEIGNLKNLQHLDVSYNSLDSLPPEIGKLTNLRVLNLAASGLKSLPLEIGNLVNLKSLNLGRISIELDKIPSEIRNLVSLRSLILEENIYEPEQLVKIRKLLPDCEIKFVIFYDQ